MLSAGLIRHASKTVFPYAVAIFGALQKKVRMLLFVHTRMYSL